MVVPGRDEDRVWTKVCALPGSISYNEERRSQLAWPSAVLGCVVTCDRAVSIPRILFMRREDGKSCGGAHRSALVLCWELMHVWGRAALSGVVMVRLVA